MPKHVPPWTTTVLPHLKIAWGGSLGTPAVEVWTNSLNWSTKDPADMANVHGLGVDGLRANTAGLAQAISDWYSSQINTASAADDTTKGAGISPTAKLEWVKLNYINAAGKYEFASNTFFYPAPIPGGGVNTSGGPFFQAPWQMTTAITMRTGVSRGRGSHGRIYPPMAGVGPTLNQPYQPDGVTTAMRNNFTGLLNRINSGLYFGPGGPHPGFDTSGTAEHHPGNVVVVSVSPHSGPNIGAAPINTVVTRVEVDEVPDVQTNRVNRVARRVVAAQDVSVNI